MGHLYMGVLNTVDPQIRGSAVLTAGIMWELLSVSPDKIAGVKQQIGYLGCKRILNILANLKLQSPS